MSGLVLCSACRHRLRADLDVGLIAGTPLRKLANQYGVSKSALQRHKEQHLEDRVREDAAKAGGLEAGTEPNLWTKLEELDGNYKRIARKAEANKNFPAAITANDKRREIAELQGRVRGELVPEAPTRGGDTFNIVAGDVDAGLRIAEAYKLRHGSRALPGTALKAEKIEGDA